MTAINKLTVGMVIIISFLSVSIHAQSAGPKLDHFAATWISFDYPSGYSVTDVFWVDRYGNISWEDEKARLDNFAIQLLNEPNQIGYIIVNVGLVSCKGEAQGRAARAKRYMVQVRGVPENRIIWRDIGYRESFEVSLWLVPLGKPPRYNPDFESASSKHVVKKCAQNIRKWRSAD